MSLNTKTKTKTPYTYFYCDEADGMRLRSGTTINHIKKTSLFEDLKALYYKEAVSPFYEEDIKDFAFNYCNDCFSIINLIRFLEKNHESLRTDAYLVNHYKEQLNNLNSLIEMIEKGNMKCKCWHYHSWRITEGACMLTEEHDYLQSLDHSGYHVIKNINKSNPLFYNYRALYRLYNCNFLTPTDKEDTDGNSVKEHNYMKILSELKIWRQYFRKEHITRVNVASQVLNKITIQDCAGKILEFL